MRAGEELSPATVAALEEIEPNDLLWFIATWVLDRDEWAVFERVYLDGMSYGAAARDLDRNPSGVRRRYLRAIRKVNQGLRFPSVVRERVEWRRADPRAERRFRIVCGEDVERSPERAEEQGASR